jgi:hypothetical protein
MNERALTGEFEANWTNRGPIDRRALRSFGARFQALKARHALALARSNDVSSRILEMRRRAIEVAATLISVWSLGGCSTVPSDARVGLDAPSASEQDFGPVAEYLGNRCGTLDCHGQIGRNFRIWGCEGMRLDPNAIPQCSRNPGLGGSSTSPAEHYATYRSLVGLEPAVMSTVVAGGGQHPELLTFIRKARGIESHKGGTLIVPGDVQDDCITSWLSGPGKTDPTKCAMAFSYPIFPLADASAE